MTSGAAARPGWRDLLIAEAAVMTRAEGWAAVTMAGLAARVGVSRQTVYNELGSKPALAEALVMHELAVFLAAVDDAFGHHPDDLVAAVRAAARSVLEMALANPLLHAVLSAGHGAESDLLPLLTSRSEPLLDAARAVIAARFAHDDLPLTPPEVETTIEMVVRLTLSHVMRPSQTPARTADDVAWLVQRVLRPE
ncbi:TetR family transcriptional regulator [Dermatophilaceae bacterium Soc4.6]